MGGDFLEKLHEWIELGKYIRKIRDEKGISAYSIEKKYGFSRNFWSRIESGTHKSAMKPDLLKKIAEILEVNYIEFYLIVGYLDEESLNAYYNSSSR